MNQTQFLQGKEAEEFVNKLHLKTVVSEKSDIAFYEGSGGTLTVYITYYQDNKIARQEMNRMINKMQTTETIFIKGRRMEIADQDVFRCFGMGQTHYIFALDEKLFWVSANTMIAADFIEYYMDYIN
ncbi:MAG: hypothetical protein H6627_02535 [Calditrichae bacterium]|nr:hypothetical protein [Calditrichia bacterium]